jgi:hypothetical protein
MVPVQNRKLAPKPVEAVVTVDTSAVAVDSALVEEPEEVAIMSLSQLWICKAYRRTLVGSFSGIEVNMVES